MKTQKGAVALTVSPSYVQLKLTARVPAGRSTSFRGYVKQYHKNDCEAYQKPQGFRPGPVSHQHHLPSQGSGQPPATALFRRITPVTPCGAAIILYGHRIFCQFLVFVLSANSGMAAASSGVRIGDGVCLIPVC